VDQVLSGSTLRVELLPKEGKHKMVTINLAGCNTDRPPRRDDTNAQNPNQFSKSEQLALESQRFTEERLLGQEVKVKMLLADKLNNIYATVLHPNGRIAVSLLKQGLAMYDPWTTNQCDPAEQRALLAAVNEAKEKRIGIWKDKDPKSVNTTNDDFILATVTQVVAPYTVMVKLQNNKEERYTLSSIRAPRPKEDANEPRAKKEYKKEGKQSKKETAEPKKGKEKEEKRDKRYEQEELLAHEAKEFLRRKTIGQEVQIYKEYTREVSNEAKGGEKSFATIYITSTKENVALSLVRGGLAEVVFHRQGEPRSREYENLDEAEKEAKKKNKIEIERKKQEEKQEEQLQVKNLNIDNQLWIIHVSHYHERMIKYVRIYKII